MDIPLKQIEIYKVKNKPIKEDSKKQYMSRQQI